MYQSAQLINCKQKLHTINDVQLMGILNITPDSFYDGGRYNSEIEIRKNVSKMISEGARIIDIGAYSSRPGAALVSEADEIKRLSTCLKIIKTHFPKIVLSIDTFRSTVAKLAIEEFGASIINDISGGDLDKNMGKVIAQGKATYVLMHMKGTPQTMQKSPSYIHITAEILKELAFKVNELHEFGVNDIIIDPGFGFGKTMEHNYTLLSQLKIFNLLGKPILVGISRKSMLYNAISGDAATALNATTAAHAIALQNGANILRVHDVKEANECIKIFAKTLEVNKEN